MGEYTRDRMRDGRVYPGIYHLPTMVYTVLPPTMVYTVLPGTPRSVASSVMDHGCRQRAARQHPGLKTEETHG